ncbi:hypothetical protein [Chryseobacterium indologenes]|uniref:hypothetical protein n=1 Tax=Chryseobacterium indologenes TaxID=253 RepID=UPI0009A1D2EC|nr:hypothetical protein [Chryseobacterium indologenes]
MNIKNSKYYNSLTKYQKSIVDQMIDGAVLKCNEGKNYKAWLKFPNGDTKPVRVNSAEIITNESSYQFLKFGNEGISIKANN